MPIRRLGCSLMLYHIESKAATMRAITQRVFLACRSHPYAMLAKWLCEITLEAADLPTGCSRFPSLPLLFGCQGAGLVAATASAENRKPDDDRCEQQNIKTSKNIPEICHTTILKIFCAKVTA
jgi:hypothetical protein